jgi:hypothetical protein
VGVKFTAEIDIKFLSAKIIRAANIPELLNRSNNGKKL